MTIEEIFSKEDISTRSFNVCTDNNLNDLSSILNHFDKYYTFSNLKNCGARSNKELIEIYLKYTKKLNSSNLDTKNDDRSLTSLLKNISARSLNICISNELKDIHSLSQHYQKHKTFSNLKNCGKKSNEELIEICLEYNNKEEPSSKIISKLTRPQREIVNSFIEINANNLSIRSKNSITTFLNGNLKIRNIIERILTNNRFNFQDIKNAGTKTVEELKSFFDLIIEFIEKVAEVENENDLVALRSRFFIEKTFSISSIPDKILESQSIFSLVDFLISENAIFEKNENIIFQKALKIYENQPELTLDEIAEEINISRERVRQIRKGALENLFNNLQFVKNIDDDLYQKYGIDRNQDLINLDDALNKRINEANNSNFSVGFNTFLIYSYISDKFDLVGVVEDVLQAKFFNSRDRHNWDNFYLVSNQLTKEFDFNNFADDIDKRMNVRNEKTYSFNFKSYLSNFIKIEDNSLISKVFPVAERIINKEFDLTIDLNDDVVFKRNTDKQVPEYAIEALEKLGVPSKIEEIYKLIQQDGPVITKSHEALRGSLQRTPEIIYFGRSSTYGLKKWELEMEGIKGGTIKNMAIDYLQKKDEPIHIYELLYEVQKYREDTNAKSLITNLKVDPSKKIIVFNQSFIGLKEKEYDSNLTNLPKFLGKNIMAFIRKHKKIDRFKTEKHFCEKHKISEKNSNYIIQQLIDNKFAFIDSQNNLYV